MGKDIESRDWNGNVFRIKDGTDVPFVITVSSQCHKQILNDTEFSLLASARIVVTEGDWFLYGFRERISSEQIRTMPVIGEILYANCVSQLSRVVDKKSG